MTQKLSDYDYMHDPKDITEHALGMLEGVRLIEFADDGIFYKANRLAVVGQDLAEKVPSAVMRDGVNMYYVDYEALVPVLVGAINCLLAKGASDHAQLIALEERVAALEPQKASEVAELKADEEPEVEAVTASTKAKAKK